MDEEGAKKLVRDAITAGIINDMGSGSNVDIAVIKPGDDITYFRYVNSRRNSHPWNSSHNGP